MRGMRIGIALRCTWLLVGWAAMTAEAEAANRCKDAQGNIIYQQQACPVIKAPQPTQPTQPTLPCTLTADKLREATRSEGQFFKRYPEEALHRGDQLKDLKPVVDRIRIGHKRFYELAAEREPLAKEAAFYVSGPMPAWLQSKLDANDAQFTVLAEILRDREQDIGKIQARYQCQRDTFGMVWGDAAPGSSACNRPACTL
jgi:hypothetical protein